jgi:hypothetical protein
MTVPSTAIVGRGRVVALNFGFAARETLLRQIHGL